MVDVAFFNSLLPLHSLPPLERAALARSAKLSSHGSGQTLFVRGDLAPSVAYLLEGSVELSAEQGMRTIHAGSDAARSALCSAESRRVTATCLTSCRVLHVDRRELELALIWFNSGEVEVHEGLDGDDWTMVMLRNPAFQSIPAANVAAVVASVETLRVAAGTQLIQQGDPGDFYYVLTAGECAVLRQSRPGQPATECDRLGPGDAFGEEALASGLPRNATVRAVTDCELVRLPIERFKTLLRDPLVHRIEFDKIDGSMRPVDVRSDEEFEAGHLPGAINLPLAMLRERLADLPNDAPLAIYCDSGRRSAAATFLLRERGFDAHLVRGGVGADRLDAVQGQTNEPPAPEI